MSAWPRQAQTRLARNERLKSRIRSQIVRRTKCPVRITYILSPYREDCNTKRVTPPLHLVSYIVGRTKTAQTASGVGSVSMATPGADEASAKRKAKEQEQESQSSSDDEAGPQPAAAGQLGEDSDTDGEAGPVPAPVKKVKKRKLAHEKVMHYYSCCTNIYSYQPVTLLYDCFIWICTLLYVLIGFSVQQYVRRRDERLRRWRK